VHDVSTGGKIFAHPKIELAAPLGELARPTESRSKFDPKPDPFRSNPTVWVIDLRWTAGDARILSALASCPSLSDRLHRGGIRGESICSVLTLPDAADQVMDC
jgi:hypothetical protein